MTTEPKTDAPQGKSPWDDLKRMADEVRLKLHLGGMEAKERWRALEPKLHEAHAKVEARGEQVGDAVQEHMVKLVDGLRGLLDDLRKDLEIGRKPAEAPPATTAPVEATPATTAAPAAEVPPPDAKPDPVA